MLKHLTKRQNNDTYQLQIIDKNVNDHGNSTNNEKENNNTNHIDDINNEKKL